MDITQLIKEIERYLAAVALYRELGCEPSWTADWPKPDHAVATDPAPAPRLSR